MDFKPTYSQLQFLLGLAFSGENPTTRRSGLEAADRRELKDIGLIEFSGSGSAQAIELTETGWDWLGKNMSYVPADARRAGFLERVPLAMAAAISQYIDSQGVKLRDLVFPVARDSQVEVAAPDESDVEPATTVVETPGAPESLAEAIREAYMNCTDGKSGVRVHLADVRKQLDFWNRDEVDAALLALYRDGRLSFDRVDDPSQETQSDQDAALWIHDNPRHFVSWTA